MDLDGQSIERRDFPITRRGYDPAVVDSHLAEVAAAVAELQREASKGETLGASAAVQIQGIIDAAEEAAAEITGKAEAEAERTTTEARQDAARTREQAIAQARAHVTAAADSTAALRARLESMSRELDSLMATLSGGAAKLAGELRQTDREMEGIYDRSSTPSAQAPEAHDPLEQATPVGGARDPSGPGGGAAGAPEASSGRGVPQHGHDLDGARLVALNMALNGDSREATDRYLAENFDLPERRRLVDEVFAAVEG